MVTRDTNAKAFTLVELIVGMAIIAILVGLSILGLATVQRSVRDTQRVATLESINLEVEALRGAQGVYPTLNATAVASATTLTLVSNTTISVGTRAITLSGPTTNAATTTADGTDYCYAASATRSDYCLRASLENGNSTGFGNATACTLGTVTL